MKFPRKFTINPKTHTYINNFWNSQIPIIFKIISKSFCIFCFMQKILHIKKPFIFYFVPNSRGKFLFTSSNNHFNLNSGNNFAAIFMRNATVLTSPKHCSLKNGYCTFFLFTIFISRANLNGYFFSFVNCFMNLC